jgi:hypothetical protein
MPFFAAKPPLCGNQTSGKLFRHLLCNLITAVEEEKWSGSEQESGEGLSVIQVSIRNFIRIVRSMRAHFD